MPNQPKTPVRTVRIPDEIWDAAQQIARERGENVADLVRGCLVRYIRRHQTEREQQ